MSPEVSLLVPTHSKWSRLRVVLESFRHQTFRDFEVVVCDDGSTDGTAEGLRALRPGYPLTVVGGTRAGAAAARNHAAARARGGILVFSDDDMVAAPGFLSRHREALTAADVLSRGLRWTVPRGRVDALLDTTPDGGSLTRLWAEARLTRAESWAMRALGRHPGHHYRFLQTCTSNLAVRRETFNRVGGFDERFGTRWGAEDTEFGFRAQVAGVPIAATPEALNLHLEHSRDSGAKFRAGRANFELFRDKYPGRRDVAAVVDYVDTAIRSGHASTLFDEQSHTDEPPPVITYPHHIAEEATIDEHTRVEHR